MKRMIPQHETVLQNSYSISLPRGQIGQVLRPQGGLLLAIVSRVKVDPSLTVYTAWFRIRSAACPLRALHRCFREITITRGFHPCLGAQGANLVSIIWTITGSDTEPVQETATQMSFETMGSTSRGILKFINFHIIK
jgi:hypothetical protein